MSAASRIYQESAFTRQPSSPYAGMPSFASRPTSPHSAPLVKAFRFSTQQHQVQINGQSNGNARRSSKIPDIITAGLRRNRTSSLPPRPQSSDGCSKTEPGVQEESTDSIHTTSVISVADPFAAHPSQSTSFVTYDPPSASSVHDHSRRPLNAMQHQPSSSSAGPSSSPSTSASPVSRRRGSILGAASDAFTNITTFGRKKRPARPRPAAPTLPTPILLSEVIEISASSSRRHQDEDEERERLRDVAAQSLGLGPVLLEDALSKLDSGDRDMDMDHEDFERASDDRDRPPESDITGFSSISISVPTPPPLPISQSSALPPSSSTNNPFSSRARSGSVARSHHSHSNSHSYSHSRANSTTPLPGIPAFPTTHALIKPFIQETATVPKHYPPPSLLMFALAKQWKSRFIVLSLPSPIPSNSSIRGIPAMSTSPGSTLRPSSGPAVSYLHLFKSSGADEKELERLEINDDSVVFLSDEEVGGRRNVVKVGGVDVGALKKELNTEESGRTIWMLQIPDSGEAQRWIAGIKGAVLSQRSVRAGLGAVSHSTGGAEPRGDLDTMLQMRSHSLLPSHSSDSTTSIGTPRVQSPVSPPQSILDHGLSPPSTLSRPHSRGNPMVNTSGLANGNTGSPPSTPRLQSVAVSALKGLFTGNRPRSPSAASVTSEPELHQEESFGSVGANLMMLRSNSFSSERPFSPTSSVFSPASPATPSTPRISNLEQTQLLDRKILQDSDIQLVDWSSSSSPPPSLTNGRTSIIIRGENEYDGQLRTFGSPSLQPPPRRRAWTASGPSLSSTIRNTDSMATLTYHHANGSTAESLGVRHQQQQPQSANLQVQMNGYGTFNGNTIGYGNGSIPSPTTADGSPRSNGKPRSSWSSTSSFASNDHSHPGSPTDAFGNGNGNGSVVGNGRRWSRSGTLPQRLTPPSGSPPSPPVISLSRASTSPRHPYAAERSSSRSSSIKSSPSHPYVDLRPLSPKRASGSSMQSFTTESTSQSRAAGKFSRRLSSSHRFSIPPPQRPAPNSALPPTPKEDPVPQQQQQVPQRTPQSAPATKTSFREILSHRAHRLSLSPPSTAPPSSTLPPRPDEPGFRPTHRKSVSGGSVSNLYPIPASPTPRESPFPPPNGPLPPTPSPTPGSTSPTPPPRITTSFKQRLRILSTPTSSSSSTPIMPVNELNANVGNPPLSIFVDTSLPATPIGEPITTLWSDPNFLLMSPPTPPLPRVVPLRPDSDDNSEVITSLSPPPRRGSRRISTPDKEKFESDDVPPLADILADDETVTTTKDRYDINSRVPPPLTLPPSPPTSLHPVPSSPISLTPIDATGNNHPPLIQVHEPPDQPLETDDTNITAHNSPIPLPARSSEHSAVSLVDVSI